ncbi:MAG: peptidoglycan DD-metalloendopeptidase family protein [Candidatus Peribacteraceae bacterium]|jgi:murein DD-endopeptidase MepM/ murein hydrolase activator NlpD
MTHHNRFVILMLLGLVLVPSLVGTVLSGDVRGVIKEQFSLALEKANDTYRTRSAAQATGRRSEKTVLEARARLAAIGKEVREVRFEIRKLRDAVAIMGHQSDQTFVDLQRLRAFEAKQLELSSQYMREFSVQRLAMETGPRLLQPFLRQLSGNARDAFFHERASVRVQQDLLTHLALLQDATALQREQEIASVTSGSGSALFALEARHEALSAEARKVGDTLAHAERTVAASEAQLKEAQRIMDQVHADVLRLQGQLERIDAKLREKAERVLMEKGLLDPQAAKGSATAYTPAFLWPLKGRITATFHDAGYLERFGVPHEGADIAQSQGTPVKAAADGIIFLVRDGGATGYTYVLIGHRGGYATLYGHLSEVVVTQGQEIVQGEPIGLSGGRPGTPGAGILTTGEHLHLEVIKSGSNIDPLKVLF